MIASGIYLSWGLLTCLVLLVSMVSPLDQQQQQDSQQSRAHTQFQEAQLPPAPMSQDDARQLSHYMMQYGPLNLANMNDRNLINKPKVPINSPPVNLIRAPQVPVIGNRKQQHQSQLLVPASSQKRLDHQRMMPLVDHALPQQVAAGNLHHHGGLKKLIGPPHLPKNCITQAIPLASTCEDRLIKRLSQDATEGRTVVDVSRRVCCALFFHKECVDSQVLKVCPDSNPSAADLLLGSRNLDLTMSCQRFNRDGCNTATRGTTPQILVSLIAISTLILLFIGSM